LRTPGARLLGLGIGQATLPKPQPPGSVASRGHGMQTPGAGFA